MTEEELQALAARIAELLQQNPWIAGPVRPEPPGAPTPGQLPPWAGAAQRLSDVAPVPGRKTASGRHRPAYDTMTAAVRQAAAGRGPAPLPGGSTASREGREGGRTVPIAISNRHIHITQGDFERLFGAGKGLTPDRPITQPGQFASHQRVKVIGPKGSIDGVRIVGPARQSTQVELSAADCRAIGIEAPIRHSGSIAGSASITLVGTSGSITLPEGAIIAARHIHVSPGDTALLRVADGDRVTVTVGPPERRATLPDVLVRSGAAHATEMHVDVDEAHAFGLRDGDLATLVGRATRSRGRATAASARPLITERDVDAVAARGETLSDSAPYRLTPLARDRARALGIWRESK